MLNPNLVRDFTYFFEFNDYGEYGPLLQTKLYKPTQEDLETIIKVKNNKLYLTTAGKELVNVFEEMPYCGSQFPVQIRLMCKMEVYEEKDIEESEWTEVPIESLSGYFQEIDRKYFNIWSDHKGNYRGGTLDGYFEYLNTFPLLERVNIYNNYLRTIDCKISEVPDYNYVDGRAYHQSMNQTEEYDTILQPGNKYYLVSDGVGVASMMCLRKGIEYRSNEPNAVGSYARRLGIIQDTDLVYDSSYIYVYFFCQKYYTVPIDQDQKYVIWDIDSHKYPGHKLLSTLSVSSNLREEWADRIVKWKKYHRMPHLRDQTGFPLDAVMRTIMINYNMSMDTMFGAQFLYVSSEKMLGVISKTGIFDPDFWVAPIKHRKERGIEKFTPTQISLMIRNKVVLFYSGIFPYRDVDKIKFRKDLGLLIPNYPCSGVFDGNFLTVGQIDFNYTAEYTRDGKYFIIPAKTGHIYRLLRLKEEDRYIFNKNPYIKIVLINHKRVGKGYLGIYAAATDTSEKFSHIDIKT